MPDVNWPEAYAKLEEAYVSTLPTAESQAEYWKNRSLKAEEEVASKVIADAKIELKAKYPQADLDEVAGKTVAELEASFKTSQTRTEKAHAAALESVRGEVTAKVAGLDEAVQAEIGDIFKAWGKMRVPPPEDQGDNQDAKSELRVSGINLDKNTEPTTFDDMLNDKVTTALGGFLRTIPIIKREPAGAAAKK